jgi:predicted AAA+ superfamily ATPase
MDIPRNELRKDVKAALDRASVCLLQGPRQSGKTYLARGFTSVAENFFDLENLVDQRRLEENPQGELGRLIGLVVIDEAQRIPGIFPVLRVLADRPENPAKFLLLGSAAPYLVRGVSESLAGRTTYIDMGGFSVGELEPQYHETLWLQGGLPPAFLSDEPNSYNWRLDYLRSVIEQDLRDLATLRLPPAALRRFLLLLAQSNGTVWKHSTAARVLSVDNKTVQRYLELFEGTFLIRLLPPFERNLNKRLRKAPKLYFRDAGLAHALIGIRSQRELRSHPMLGASWEGFGLEQVIRVLRLRESECFHYGVHGGDEMDLVVERGAKRYGFEFKASDSPGATLSMHNSLRDLGLRKVFVIHTGDRSYFLNDKMEAVGIRNLPQLSQTWEDS